MLRSILYIYYQGLKKIFSLSIVISIAKIQINPNQFNKD
jgi:hypothetical protein